MRPRGWQHLGCDVGERRQEVYRGVHVNGRGSIGRVRIEDFGYYKGHAGVLSYARKL